MIQVAGILDQREAEMLLGAGADLLGFPLGLDVNAEDIGVDEVRRIVQALKIQRRATVITYLRRARDVIDLCNAVGSRKLQLHGEIELQQLVAIRAFFPDLFIIKSLIVGADPLAELRCRAEQYEPHVDAFIVDTYDPTSGASGATGKVHDWQVSSTLVCHSRRPVLLAGGLSANNVAQAIGVVQPAGVDVHTGVEDRSGRKDPELVARFIDSARTALAEIDSADSATTKQRG